MQSELHAWLVESGFPNVTDLTQMTGGLGSNEMWSFRPSPGADRLVARIFGEGSLAAADREALAMDTAAAHGLPVPEVVARGTLANRPVLVTAFISGVPAGHLARTDEDQAYAVGVAMGETQGRLNQIIAPDGLSNEHAWIERGGPAIAPLRLLLEAVQDQDRLLHLDYHPLNVMMDDGHITGVIDWENTLAGPPHMDLGRSRATLRAIAILGMIDSTVIARLDDGLVAGHASVIGDDPHPDLSAAWGLAVTADDLSRQVGKPGGGITESLVSQLARERNVHIRRILEDRTGGHASSS